MLTGVRPAVRVSDPHDQAEIEAERVAAELVGPSGGRKGIGFGRAAASTDGDDHPLPAGIRSVFEARFDHDLSAVRVRTGADAARSAASFQAAAYTSGHDIVFGPGQYAPDTGPGQRLLAHELTHVVQQDMGRGLGGGRGEAVVQRQVSSRDELLKAFRDSLAEAGSDPSKWQTVALRLNGFDRNDIMRLAASLTGAELTQTRAAVRQYLAGWPQQPTIFEALQAAAKAKGVPVRPSSASIWAAYSPVAYGTMEQPQVWKFVGGPVGRDFDGDNTCATRVSYSLNYGGVAIRSGKLFFNDPSVKFSGKPGDGKNYIVGAVAMKNYLTAVWGQADAALTTPAEVSNFEATLISGQVAIFAGQHHAGLIMQGYKDPYVFTHAVRPVDAWRLS